MYPIRFRKRIGILTDMPSHSPSPSARRFIEFALCENVSAQAGSPTGHLKLTSNAHRLSLNLRFRAGSSQLDNKDLHLHYSGSDVMLPAFAHPPGSADQGEQHGLKARMVSGFGSPGLKTEPRPRAS